MTPSLATPALNVAGPNVDTLYGYAWIDLAHGPLVLTVPDTHDRYDSIQFVDAYGNTFSYVGRRQTGTKAGVYVLTPPGWTGKLPDGAKEIPASTSLVFSLTRTLVRGDKDLAAAQQVQQSYTLGPLAAYPHGQKQPIPQENALNVLPILDLSKSGPAYFDQLGTLIKAYPPPLQDQDGVSRFANAGIGAGLTPSHNPALAPLLAKAVPSGLARIHAAKLATGRQRLVRQLQDNELHSRSFGQGGRQSGRSRRAHRKRSSVFSANGGPDGKPVSGKANYKLVFPAGHLPPVDAFWSLTLYGPDYRLVENPIKRYAINDRTAGLAYGADGSLAIHIQHAPPAAGQMQLAAGAGRAIQTAVSHLPAAAPNSITARTSCRLSRLWLHNRAPQVSATVE